MKRKIESLINLLDDSDIQVVQEAMAELLKHEAEINEYLGKHQESGNPKLRRRIHQLQAIMIMRRRRESFAPLLNSPDLNLIDGLIAVHLQWYDNDSEDFLRYLWSRFLKTSERFAPENLNDIAYFMRKCGFQASSTDDFQADSFCIGPVLEELAGADFILCALAAELAGKWGFELALIRVMDNFMLIDKHGRALSPRNSWQIVPDIYSNKCELWTKKQIIELASTMLFTFAVSSNSFRYIHTIGYSLAKALGEDQLDFLPYPYGPQNEEK